MAHVWGIDEKMSVIYIALPIALALGASGLFACLYCIRSGQYEDMETPQIRILMEGDAEETKERERS